MLDQIRTELNQTYFERDEEITAALTCLLARQHCLMLGPPGTAKSALIKDLCERIGGNYFQWLLTKFSTPEELFGPISLKSLEQDQYKRITANKLPEAHIAFVDEIWKSSSSILNTLLTLVNEREFHNNGSPIKVPLISMFAASNELPDTNELTALYDRFLVRLTSNYLADRKSFESLLKSNPPAIKTKITLVDLQQMHTEVDQVTIHDSVYDTLLQLREELRKENIIVSDRRYKQSLSLIKAFAYLNGRKEAVVEDLLILQHVLWSQPSERKLVQKHILNVINPTLTKVQEYLDIATEIYNKALDPNLLKDPVQASQQGVETNVKLKEISRKLAELKPTNPASEQTLREAKTKVNAYTSELLEKLLGLNNKRLGT